MTWSTSGDFLSMDSNISTWETTMTAPNGSIYFASSHYEIIVQATMYLSLIFALIGIAGNVTVLWILGFQMNRNAFSVYILNLAVADFLFLSFQFVDCLFAVIFLSSEISINLPSFLTVVESFAYLSGLSILSAISVERCLSVLWPICCANPIIYFFIGSIRHHRSQRKSLKLFLQRAFQDTPEEEGGERACSRETEEQL
ncbi:hypothetical protein U0070_005817 [Myodes glareolus]|uniref:G-protein coupled receptors family 1 profile domain-containing protein n=1 Tax=Myodes glareolus TaxID=447135 RepID=A0AAW0H3W4_MYOGA